MEDVKRSDEPTGSCSEVEKNQQLLFFVMFEGSFHRSETGDPIVACLHPNIKF
jgi:hypothetical protein